MLDYTLVTTQATYRPLAPTDVSAFVALVTRRYREERVPEPLPPGHVLALLQDLDRYKERGALLVFEVEESLAGSAIMRPRWCTVLGGPELVIEELYVAPEHRGRDLASDFIALLKKVTPQDCRRITWETPRGEKKNMDACRRLGFKDTGRVIFSVETGEDR